jgi:hypothetical protein
MVGPILEGLSFNSQITIHFTIIILYFIAFWNKFII